MTQNNAAVVVELKSERPSDVDPPADSGWVRETCDDCGRSGYTIEDARDNARGRFGPVVGLRCTHCDY